MPALFSRRKSTKQKLWMALIFATVVGCAVFIYASLSYGGDRFSERWKRRKFLAVQEKLTSRNCTPMCGSKDVWHANMLLKNMDSTADPCEDFLSFLCGGFRDRFGPGDARTVFKETDNFLINKLKGILENIRAKPGSALAKMKTVYDSCVNYGSSELQGLKELKNFLESIGISNWPYLERDFNFSGISIPIVLGQFIAFSAEDMFYLVNAPDGGETQEDQANAEKNHLWVYFIEYKFDKRFGVPREVAVSILKYFDLETKDMDRIVKDHNYVKYSIMWWYNQSRPIETCGNCPDAYIHCPNEDKWYDFCETLDVILNFTNPREPTNTSVIEVVDSQRFFLQHMFPILKRMNKRMLANFIVLSFIKGYQAELSFYFRLRKLKHDIFEHKADKDRYELDRWKHCTRWIIDNMHVPLVNEFYHQYISTSVSEELIKMYKDYSSEVMDLVAFQEWIPDDLKSRTLNRIKNASFNLDTLSRLYPDDSFVDKFYKKFLPSRDNFFNNVLRLKILSNFIESSSFETNDVVNRLMTVFEVQGAATYNLAIHFGLLVPPFHVPGYNLLLNRLMLAPAMIHELGHFVYLNLGYYMRDNNKFLEKRQCIWDQFSRFKFEYLNEYLDGSNYESENFPDSVAVTVIDKVIEKHSSMQIILPGLPYTTKQLLYMTSFQTKCAKSNLERDIFYTKDQHAPLELRLQAMIQNSRGFSDAFHCRNGSYMNPKTKCSLLDRN